MNRALWDTPALLRIESNPGKGIGHHVTLDRFGWMTRPPAYDVAPESRLTKDVPERFAFARCACIRPRSAVNGIRLDEPVNTMFVGKFAGSYRVPQHGRKDWLK